MFKKLAIVCMALAFVGCAQLAQLQEKGAEEAGRVITQYCNNTDELTRSKFRGNVNRHAAPNSVRITCADHVPLVMESAE